MNKSGISKVGAGILDGLEQLEDLNSSAAKAPESKGVKEEKSKGVKEVKSKRSFMLTDQQIEMLYMLKAKSPKKDLSELVGEAIEKLYSDPEVDF